jgi:hypothetical protein
MVTGEARQERRRRRRRFNAESRYERDEQAGRDEPARRGEHGRARQAQRIDRGSAIRLLLPTTLAASVVSQRESRPSIAAGRFFSCDWRSLGSALIRAEDLRLRD